MKEGHCEYAVINEFAAQKAARQCRLRIAP
jgi:hypothetical protein